MSCVCQRYAFPIGLHAIRSECSLQGGVTGILCQGSNGEAQHLSHEERSDVIRFTRKTLDDAGFKDTLVIAGTGGQSTRETIKLNKDAAAAGAAYALILTPATWKPILNKDLIVRFHREVAEASPIPTMVTPRQPRGGSAR